jgi:hypothetical protein
MAIIKSKTITASGYNKGPMQFDHILREDGIYYVHYSQGYQLTNENGQPVSGVQDKYVVEGEISDADLQRLLPNVWNALVFLYGWFDGEIKKQEGIA